jgi:hypothetical protein
MYLDPEDIALIARSEPADSDDTTSVVVPGYLQPNDGDVLAPHDLDRLSVFISIFGEHDPAVAYLRHHLLQKSRPAGINEWTE